MRHPESVFGWVDLLTNDVETARSFYSELFGWTSTDMPTPMGPDYTQFFKDGQVVAGMAPIPPDAGGMPPMWNSYVMVPDLDASLAKVAGAGGQVVMPAMDVMTQGRMAMVADPSGGVVGLWQPQDHQGFAMSMIPGSVAWNELQTSDLPAARTFYEQVFGWRWELSEPAIDYWVCNVDAKPGDDKSTGGAMPMPSMAPEGMPSMWFVYFTVTDCDATLARVTELGGTTLFDPMQMGPGRFAGATDPTGGMFFFIAFDAPPT